MKSHKLISLLIALVMLVGMIPSAVMADSNKFKDIKTNYWANEYIQTLVNSGILSGYANGNFAPENGITREEFAVILFKTFGLDEINPNTPTFKDVDATRWSYPYIEATKEYLTGYFPPNGKALFDPEGSATREDVAVALVRALNLDANTNISSEKYLYFNDASDVSPNLRDEVALAVKNKLISGFPNGTLQPAAPVTRAQASAMVYKILKNTYVKSTLGYSADITIPTQVFSPQVPIAIKLPANSNLVINNKTISYAGTSYSGNYALDQPGTYTLNISITYPNFKKETFTRVVTYTAKAPVITLMNAILETATSSILNLKFTVSDSSSGALSYVSVNGTKVSKALFADYYATALTLKEGVNNIVIEAKNAAGLVTQNNYAITYAPASTTLNIINLPTSSTKAQISFDVKITDPYDSYEYLYVNDERYTVYNNKTKTLTYTLSKGDNTLVFKIINSRNKLTTITKVVNYTASTSTITLKSATTSTTPNYTLNLNVFDSLYIPQYLSVSVNGKAYAVPSDGNLSIASNLVLGANTFTVEVTNPDGLVTKSSFVVTYSPVAPVISGSMPDTVSTADVSWLFTVFDGSGTSISATLNSVSTAVVSKGNNQYEITLNPTLLVGSNSFYLKVTSDSGQSAVYQKTVTFVPTAPTLSVNDLPATVTDPTLTLSGSVSDASNKAVTLTVSGVPVVPASGSFTQNITLTSGVNTFTVSATNVYGLTTTVIKTVTYTPNN